MFAIFLGHYIQKMLHSPTTWLKISHQRYKKISIEKQFFYFSAGALKYCSFSCLSADVIFLKIPI